MAAISAQNDAMTGDLVADDMERIGSEGVITGEESTSTETTLDVVEGMQFGGGFLLEFFKMHCGCQVLKSLLNGRSIEGLGESGSRGALVAPALPVRERIGA